MNNARFSGKRFSHDRLVAALRRRKRTVLSVDESYTTKRCAACALRGFRKERDYDWTLSAPLVDVSVKKKKSKRIDLKNENKNIYLKNENYKSQTHRYVRCPTCRTGANRDGRALNILLKTLAGPPRPVRRRSAHTVD